MVCASKWRKDAIRYVIAKINQTNQTAKYLLLRKATAIEFPQLVHTVEV